MRTAGATSFSSVKLSELNRLLKPDADIPVNRRFKEMLKLHGKPMAADTSTLVAFTSKADFQVTSFDNETTDEVVAEETPAKESKKGDEQIKVSVLDSWD